MYEAFNLSSYILWALIYCRFLNGNFGGKGPFCWRQNYSQGYKFSRTTLTGEEGRSGIRGAGGCPSAPATLLGGNESCGCPWEPEHRNAGRRSAVPLLFSPLYKICKVLGNSGIFQSSERFAGAEISFTSLLYTSAFSCGFFLRLPKSFWTAE